MSYCERCGKDYGGSTHLCPPGSAQAVGVPLVTAFTCSPCPYCAELKAERDGLRQRLTEAEAAYASEHRRHSDLLGLLSEFFPPEADIRECLSTQRQRLTEADTAYRGLLQCCETHRQRVTELEAALEIEQIESETAAMDAQAAEKDKP